jgi:hypothetical protein
MTDKERLTNPHSHILMNQDILHSGKEEVLWDGVYSKDVLEEMVERLAEYEDTGLTPDEIIEHEEMFKAYRHVCGGKSPEEIERLQAENRRLKKSVDNQCDDCACEIANERDKAIKDLVEEDWRNRNE